MLRFKPVWSLGIVLFLWCNLAAAQNYGLDARQPIGPFLNNKLPSLPPGTPGGWAVVKAFPNLTFLDPVSVRPEPNSNRLYVCGREGTIYFFDNDPQTSSKTLFLDIRNRTQGWDDCGLLGLAFHPEFRKSGSPNRGYVYVYYNYSSNPIPGPSRPPQESPGFLRLSRFTVADGSMVADPSSELVLINQYDRHLWHNGGAMFFGEDGFLYLTVGDEGGANDNYLSAQKLNAGLFSGILRIDVNMDAAKSHPIRRQPISGGTNSPASSTANYFIPNDNPFLDPGGNVLEEFWAVGLRSPHSMSFDPVTKRIWQADVGQESWEEINIVERAANFQWPYKEGFADGPKQKPNPINGTDRPPIYSYPHQNGNNCVIGGYVYRGAAYARELLGKYIFGDNGSGRIWTMSYDGVNRPVVNELCTMPSGSSGYAGLSGFGLDQNGELLLCKMGESGGIYKLQPVDPSPSPPALLSQTGVFTNLANLITAPGIIPYSVNCPLWSDGAAKRRWIAVPDTSGERIKFSANNEWEFPTGTVFIKHFEIPIDENNPAMVQRLETRLLVRSGDELYGATYKWRADQSDADLLPDGLSEEITIKTKTGTRKQTWTYPSQSQCFSCHTANAKFILGIKTHQLNGDFDYSGRTDNQLRTWNHLGMFDPAINENDISSLPKAVAVDDKSAPVENRVRSYLDANCSFCHRPNGVNAYFDARFNTPLTDQGIIDGRLANSLDLENSKVIVPANLNLSVMSLRLQSVADIKMPPLARNVVDTNAVAALTEWVNGMPLSPSIIVEQPSAQDVIAGDTFTLSVVTESTAALHFQWRFNNAAIPGATSSTLTRKNAQASEAGNYSVEISNSNNSILSDDARVTVSPKSFFPVVSITSPAKNARSTNSTLTVRGTAASGAGVAEVRVAILPGEFVVADGTSNWSTTVSLAPGTNTIRAISVNKIGHQSLPDTRTVFYIVTSPLTVSVSGAGVVSPDLNKHSLEIGKSYSLKARPAQNHLFAGWSGSVFSQSPVLNFAMQSNLVLTANFISNPFVSLQGIYNGLFYEEEMVRHESSGFLTLALNPRGNFSGKIFVNGQSHSFSGNFDIFGQSKINIAHGAANGLSIAMQLDLTNQTDQILGQVGDQIWNAPLIADRAILKSQTNSSSYSGQYTLVFPGDTNDSSAPGGDGFATVIIDSAGRIRLSGNLSDATRISQSVVLSKNGHWPLYVPLYRGKGSLLSWITVGSETQTLENNFSWISTGNVAAQFYPGGFTNQFSIVGSKFFPPRKQGSALDLTNLFLSFSEGDLSTNLRASAKISGNKIISDGRIPGLSLSIQPAKGLVNGSFIHPATKKRAQIKGVVLQQQKILRGYFLGTNESGAISAK